MLRKYLVPVTLVCFVFIQPLTTGFADSPSTDMTKQIISLLSNPDIEFRAAGLDQIRWGTKGEAATKLFADQLAKIDKDCQVSLLSALADRGDVAARQPVVELLKNTDSDSVRTAAIDALRTLGNSDDVPLLVKSLSSQTSSERTMAIRTLSKLRGGETASVLLKEVSNASPSTKSALIEVLTGLRATNAVPQFIEAATDDNPQVRSAAMTGLGQLATQESLTSILPALLKAEKGGERDAAERNVAQICARIENENARGESLIKAIAGLKTSDQDQFLSLVGRVGGKKLIEYVGGIATGQDTARRKLAIDALSKWPDASVADLLLDLTNKSSDPSERSLAFQAFVKNSSNRDRRNDKQRLDRMKQAMTLAKTTEEQTLVINRARSAYDVETLRFVLPYVSEEKLAQIACETIVELAHHREIRDPNKAEFDTALDKVISTSKNQTVIERANRYKRGETWSRS